MKTLITLNIGLFTKEQNRLDVHRAIGAVAACGVSITASSVVNGEWEGKPEPCLFIQGFVPDPLAIGFRAQLFLASRLLSQHCLALYHDGRGELIGDNPEGWTFDAEKFHFHPEGRKALTHCAGCAQGHYSFYTPGGELVDIPAETVENAIRARFGENENTPLSECQAIQKETAERIAAKRNAVNGWESPENFCAYLEETLIPDLKEFGYVCTAEDFETAIAFIRRK